jgi:hypothetical protein
LPSWVRAEPPFATRLPTFAVYLLRVLPNLKLAEPTYDAGGQALVFLSVTRPTFSP